MSSSVDHPYHYNSLGAVCTNCGKPIECIDVVEWMDFNPGNAIKYVWRAPDKGKQIEDLKKAIWYILREIDHLTENDDYIETEIPKRSDEENGAQSR